MNTFFNKLKIASKKQSGFTLIEILVVIGIIAVLAVIVLIAINPAKQFAQARNTQRTANVNAILNAIGQRVADNKGVFEGAFTINPNLYTCGALSAVATGTITSTMSTSATAETGDIGCLVPTYIPALPVDPKAISGTGYEVRVNLGRVSVCAPLASAETSVPNAGAICVTR